jgi:hypothetical protein
MPDLRITTTSKRTLLWAADLVDAQLLRTTLDDAGIPWEPVRRATMADEAVVGVEIGMASVDALAAAAGIGFAFRWHEQQDPRSRVGELYGFRVDRL